MSYENWKRAYKIEIGTLDTIENYDSYLTTSEYIRLPENNLDQITIPSNAVKLSNLSEDSKDPRGFTFTFDGNLKATNNANNNSEASTLRLFNLDQQVIDIIQQKDCVVRIYAGYQDKAELAYAGDVIAVNGFKQGDDYIYELKCNGSATDSNNSLVSVDYPEDLSVKAIIEDLISRFFGISLGTSDLEFLAEEKETGGFSYNGPLIDALQLFIDRYKLTCGVQNGKIFLYPYRLNPDESSLFSIPNNNYLLRTDLIKDIRPANMNGKKTSGDVKELSGVVVNTFFLPIELGNFFTIPITPDTDYNGTYKVDQIRIKLESHGNMWDVAVTGTRV